MNILVAQKAHPLHHRYHNMSTNFAITNIANTPQDIYFLDGQIAFVTGINYTAQRIRTRLQLFLGEWPFDTSQGVPWFESVFVSNPNIVTVQSVIKNTILETPHVISLTSYSDNLDRSSREYTVQFSAITDDGLLEDQINLDTLLLGAKYVQR